MPEIKERIAAIKLATGPITLRDFFAGCAMAGCIARGYTRLYQGEPGGFFMEDCLEMADNMIEARAKEEVEDLHDDRAG